MEKKKTPQIRFAGFTDPWEQCELLNIVDQITRKNINNESTLPLTISAEYGLIDQFNYYNNRVASKDVSNYYLILNGEFAYNKSTSDGYPWGAIKRLDFYEKGVLSTLYIVFKIKTIDETQIVDSDFLNIFFSTDCWHKHISKNAAEGARNHGLLNITANDFLEMKLYQPKNIMEQKRIGLFITQLNTLITLHQRKCEKLKLLKKSMLEKMFPKNGKNVPEVRFAGFTDAWEQCELNEINDVRDGTHDSPKYVDTGFPFITSKNVKEGYINFDDFNYISEEDYNIINKRSKVDKGDILMGMIGTIGNIALIRQEPFFAIKNVALIKDVGITKSDFLYHYLESPMLIYQLKNSLDGGTQKFISLNRVRKLKISITSIEEQTKVGNFFKDLDDLITLHQRKCEKLKIIKKSMLEKMFV